ncbi:MAG: hypothetical protein A2Z19_07760 [Deltaproteobacteria bacterium RBG_16_54_18]|nr:MAG: hypothetical protein A2Z19_07760 [Deltaproteobacteria bacterium RBG_16_54_18]
MDCREVQKKLSAFADGVITAGERKQIMMHLKKCKGCKRALADLKKTIRYVQRLEEVEPPAWFVQRVMARVRDKAEKKQGIWQRFFLPLHIKVPLEAIALICMVVGAVYIFKSMEPEIRLAKIPTETRESAPPAAAVPQKEKPADVGKKRHAPVTGRERSRFEKKYQVDEERSVKVAQTPTAQVERKEAAPATGYADYDTLKRDVGSSLQEEQPQGTMALKAKEGPLVVRVRDLTAARTRVEEIARQMGGQTSTTTPGKDKAVITIVLDRDKVYDFLTQLRLVGEVRDKGWQGEQGKGSVTLTVEVKKLSGDQSD